MGDATTLPDANTLRSDPASRQGLTNQQLQQAGLSNTEIQTIQAGFTGAFGSGAAADFRTKANLTTDATGNVIPIQQPVTTAMANNAQNPQLSGAATVTPALQQVQPGEVQQTPNPITAQAVSPPANPIAPQQVQAQTGGNSAQINQNQVTAGVQTNTVNPVNTQDVGNVQSVTMQPSANSLVQNQLSNLFGQMQNGQVPSWAQGAYVQAQEQMQARGMGASSISAGATALAVMSSALPIASADANTYYQSDLNNFNAAQQDALTNNQRMQQNMLTDTATANASEQFNATSATQTQQFVSQMINSIQGQNAQLTNNMTQFNASQTQAAEATNAGNDLQAQTANANIQSQVSEFNSNLQNQTDQFNTNMAATIAQSNVNWQRTVNTADTAAVNAANQTNAQNSFNMSQTDMNNIWQQYLDEASYSFDASQTQDEFNYNSAQAATNRSFITSLAAGQALGGLGTSIISTALNPIVSSLASAGVNAITG